jgi:hypothetical protein
MAFTAVSLMDPVSGLSQDIQGLAGVTVLSLQVAPQARAVAEERVGGAGQVDSTLWLSAAAVTLSLRLAAVPGAMAPEAFEDLMGALCAPQLRPYLICSNDAWPQDRQLVVRFDSKTKIVDNPLTTDVAYSFMAPNSCWEGAAQDSAAVPAYIPASGGLNWVTAGLAWVASGLAWTAASISGSPVVVAGGNMAAPWTASLYGPATGPKFANDSAGLTLEFTDDLVLAAGEFVALDSQAHTALLNGDTASSVLGSLNFATSDWWMMQPGPNQLRYYPDAAAPGAVAELSYRPRWMA